jgi:hypothetical protein
VLRRSLGGSGLDTGAGQVRLAPGVVQLDLEELDVHAAAERWCPAAQLVAGEFMEGFAVSGAGEFEEWLAAERVVWRRRGVDVLVHCAESALQAGRAQEAAGMAQRSAVLDPCSDLAIRAWMRSLALAGDRAAALERYESFAHRVSEELDVRPEARTVALAELLRRQRTLSPPGTTRPVRETAVHTRLPLVGRAAELTRLLEVTATCCRGPRATLILVDGDAGSGKTRLLEELLARLRLDGAVVAAVRMVEADLEEPWSGVRALARGGLLDAQGIAGTPGAALAAFTGDLPE